MRRTKNRLWEGGNLETSHDETTRRRRDKPTNRKHTKNENQLSVTFFTFASSLDFSSAPNTSDIAHAENLIFPSATHGILKAGGSRYRRGKIYSCP